MSCVEKLRANWVLLNDSYFLPILPLITQAHQLCLSITDVTILNYLFLRWFGWVFWTCNDTFKKMRQESRHMKIDLNFLFITGIAFTDLPVRKVHFQTAFLCIINRCFSCNLCLPYVSWKYSDNHLNQFNIINFSSPFKWWFVKAKIFLFLNWFSQRFFFSGFARHF